MSMNLLIVDDEYEILSWLEEMFRYDFEMEIDVYTAKSALDALKLLNQIKFDVVLTDIKMPGMDGITLFKRIKSNWPRCKTIFLTGYRNFDDMYQIINHKDVRYLLKSEDDEVILQTVREVFDELQEEIGQEVTWERRQQDMEKVKSWLGKEFVETLLKGKLSALEEDELKKHACEAGISIALNQKMLLFLVRIDEKDAGIEQPAESYASLERVNQIISKNLPADIQLHMCIVEGHWSVGLVQPGDLENQDMARLFAVVRGAIEYSQAFFGKLCGRSFSAVVESTPVSYREMSAMFFNMKQIMVGGLGREEDVIAHVEAITPQKDEEASDKVILKVPMLKTYLELNHRQEYFQLLNEIGQVLIKSRSRHDSYGTELYYSVSVLLLQFINGNQLNEQIAFHVGLYKLTRVDEHESWEEAVQYLYEVSVAVFQLLANTENDLSDKALKRICDYIEIHLDQDLSLTKLADVGGFNSSYLSRLFKQVFGVTITDYINQKRMKQASILLKTTNCKIQDIAVKSGYISSHSFTRAFKGFYGTSPIEYREINKN